METLILRKEDQAQGAFDGGRIQERKPIGFPQDGGKLRPYGNLFYWAHAWANADSLIGEHPHKGFEIMSFVLKGDIEHYDSQLRGWKPLKEGDVQVIRAGSGITHAERMTSGAEIFQIWFDPGLERTLGKPATYNDYPASAFPWEQSAWGESMEYIGVLQRIALDSTPLKVERHRFSDGKHAIALEDGQFQSNFILRGTVSVSGEHLGNGDFFRVIGAGELQLETSGAELFTITNTSSLEYRTYHEMMQSRMH
jgi:quercetin 2,3-dioxygenase